MNLIYQLRLCRLMTVLVLAVFIVSCDDILSVDDPGTITEEQLNDPAMEELIINGVYSEFQVAFNSLLYWAGSFSDESVQDHTTVSVRDFVRFDFDNNNQNNLNLFNTLHKSRVMAEDAIRRITDFHNGAAGNLNVAFAQAYAGYTNVFLGEHFCESAIDNGPKITSNDHLERAISQFKEAIANAEAATSDAPRAEHIISLSNLGIARASLQMGNMDDAIAYAELVPGDFEAWVYRSINSDAEANVWGNQWEATNKIAGVSIEFQNLDDPRVMHTEEEFPGLQNNPLVLPYLPLNYEGWDPDNPRQIIRRDTNIRFASALEAQHIIAEASGPTAATLAFVNERREVGQQDPVDLSGDDLMAELRDQRARDLYMIAQRHGDLRRYIDLYNIDLFPTGIYPVTGELYGNNRCFLLPINEINANPNIDS